MNVKYHKTNDELTYDDILKGLEDMTLKGYQNKYKERFLFKHHRGILKIFKTRPDGSKDVMIIRKSERIWLKRESLEPFLNIK